MGRLQKALEKGIISQDQYDEIIKLESDKLSGSSIATFSLAILVLVFSMFSLADPVVSGSLISILFMAFAYGMRHASLQIFPKLFATFSLIFFYAVMMKLSDYGDIGFYMPQLSDYLFQEDVSLVGKDVLGLLAVNVVFFVLTLLTYGYFRFQPLPYMLVFQALEIRYGLVALYSPQSAAGFDFLGVDFLIFIGAGLFFMHRLKKVWADVFLSMSAFFALLCMHFHQGEPFDMQLYTAPEFMASWLLMLYLGVVLNNSAALFGGFLFGFLFTYHGFFGSDWTSLHMVFGSAMMLLFVYAVSAKLRPLRAQVLKTVPSFIVDFFHLEQIDVQ